MSETPYLLALKVIGNDELGYLSVVEAQKEIPFDIKRVYYTYHTPNDFLRGHHVHRKLKQFIFALAGVLDVYMESTSGEELHFILDHPAKGLYIPPGWWHTMRFNDNAVLLAFASEVYDEKDYIRDYEVFKKERF